MKKVKFLALLLVAALAFSLLAACGQPAVNEGEPASAPAENEGVKKTIVMGTNAAFEPFEYKESGEVVGFDVELAKEIAKDMGAELKIEDMAFDSLITALSGGKVDMVVAGLSVTEERKESVDFSEPYYNATQLIIVKKDAGVVSEAADLAGKRVGVQEATTGDIYTTENVKDVKVSRFKNIVDAAIDLKNGKLDAVVIDAEPSKKIIEQNSDLVVLEEALTEEEYAIAVAKGDADLLGGINETIARLKEEGKFNEFRAKYNMSAVAEVE